MEALAFLWNEVIIRPMLNTLVVLYVLLFSQMGLAIFGFTVLVRVVTLPLALKQIRQMQAMTSIQSKLKELQEKHGKDRARMSQETMRLYKEAGVSPIGCLGPMIIQMPILFGLFQVLIQTLYSNPNDLVNLSSRLYSWMPFDQVHAAAPLNHKFVGLDLAANPRLFLFVVPLLVGASTWVQQKMTTTPAMDARQQSSQNMMLWMMPIMLGVFAFQFPVGLSLYWIISNVIGIAIQYFITGWGPLFPIFPKARPAPAAVSPAPEAAPKEIVENGRNNPDRPNRRRSRRISAERAKRRPQRGRGRNTK
ncbi:MAG: YidC/Oxa1 family membrane protein insertase [SAR202 cluster bacterium]|nr:YidC/Oxa1 family membrane protein insertase [SAR202 cluster bacterium]